jgi:astacin
MIRDAIETWNAEAIVLFKLRKKQSDCVDVRVTHGADGGHSKIGRRGGVETVMSDPAYNPPYARIHELAHAVGMFHEHNRPDRDQFVKVTSTLSNTAFISVRSLIADRPS